MNIIIFTGAGISKESGIKTFRDSDDGIWNEYNIEEVCTPKGFKNNTELVLNFYNQLRNEIKNIKPNSAHLALVELEKNNDVTIITQNVDDLHEKAGSKNVLHLHGEISKATSSNNPTDVIEYGGEIKVGDLHPDGSQLRPHVVFFEEIPFNIDKSIEALNNADVLIIIGTSFNISYTIYLIANNLNPEAKVYYIDPQPNTILNYFNVNVEYIRETATEAVPLLVSKILNFIPENI
jgi:NAD-dependent deacetylase